MANVFDTLGKAQATIELAIAKQLGFQVQFRHRSQSAIPVWIRLDDRNTGLVNEGGIATTERMAKITIATGQNGFTKSTNDAEPVIPGDIFTFNGRELHVTAPIGSNKYATVYYLACVDHKAIGGGLIK